MSAHRADLAPRRPVGYVGSHRSGARELAEWQANTRAQWSTLRATIAPLFRRRKG